MKLRKGVGWGWDVADDFNTGEGEIIFEKLTVRCKL